MSYNIGRFKLKSLRLVLPKGFDLVAYEKEKTGWGGGNFQYSADVKTWTWNYNDEGLSASGEVAEDGSLVFKDMECCGEGSGHHYYDLLKPLLQEFKGDIHIVTVWEGGDTILGLKATNGELQEWEVEL